MKRSFAGMFAAMAVVSILGAAPALAQSAFKFASSADCTKVVSAANAEGRVILHTTPVPATLAQFKAAFEKAYPSITVEYTRLIGTQLVGKVDQDRAANVDGADVIITPEVTWIADRAKQGVLKQPAGPAAGAWPAKYVASGVSPVRSMQAPSARSTNPSTRRTSPTPTRRSGGAYSRASRPSTRIIPAVVACRACGL